MTNVNGRDGVRVGYVGCQELWIWEFHMCVQYHTCVLCIEQQMYEEKKSKEREATSNGGN